MGVRLPGVEGVGHLWQMPIFKDNSSFADYLLERFTPERTAATVDQLIEQARHTRALLDAEYDQQVGRFVTWLTARLRAPRVA